MPPNNSCCTYPHREGLVLPQAFMIGAIFCNIWMFIPVYDFLCVTIEYEYSSDPMNTIYIPNDGTSNSCFPLRMFHTRYWDVTDDKQGYAGAAQAGAFFGAAATAIGALTLVVLLKTVCFQTSKCAIVTVIAMQSTAALFSLLALVAGATNVCKGTGREEMNCKTKKIRIEPGAGFAISAAVFYICAIVFTTLFLRARSGWEKVNDGRVADEEVGLVMAPTHDTVDMAVPRGQNNGPSYTGQSRAAANV